VYITSRAKNVNKLQIQKFKSGLIQATWSIKNLLEMGGQT